MNAPIPNVSTVRTLTDARTEGYRDILQKKIETGSRSAMATIQRIQEDVPRDQIVKLGSVEFTSDMHVQIGQDSYSPSDYALGQLSARAGVPAQYLRELARGKDWQPDLAATILRTHHAATPDTRILARSVRGQLRGWLSDKFRRLDSRPLVDMLASEAQKIGAIPVDGTATETRVAIKLIMPTLIEPVPGEVLVYGAEWSNSDFGNGTHSLRAFALRVVCLNGMTRENIMREIHLGGRLSDDIEFSDKTHRLDTERSVSALQDMIKGTLGEGGRERMTAGIRKAHETSFTAAQLNAAVKSQPKLVAKSIVDAYKSDDVINLPPGDTAWRASNAISWIAKTTENAEVKLDLERLAGAVVQ